MNPPAPTATDAALIERLLPAVRAAGRAILAIRAAGHAVEAKADRSPVTEADRAAEAIILAALAESAPGHPVVAEEEAAAGRLPDVGNAYALVDALDGTKEFVRGGGDFTVNVGFVRDGVPIAGIVHAPLSGGLWYAAEGKAWRTFAIAPAQRVFVRRPPREGGLDVVASASHRNAETNAFIDRFPGSRTVAAGSSLKFLAVAEGRADLYPRLGPTSQWDTAAGDAILRAAGGLTLDMDGQPLRYVPRPGVAGAKAFLNPSFVASGGIAPFADPAVARPL